MKPIARTITATVIASALTLFICSACATPQQQESPATKPSTEETSTQVNVDSESVDSESETTIVPLEDGAQEAQSGIPLLEFEAIEGTAKLVSDMNVGHTPVKCNVLYDQMGSRPAVTVTDERTIAEIYELLKDITVIGESNMSITDCYHHVFFTLEDGSTVGFSFEGEGLLCVGSKNYAVTGSDELWKKVYSIQEEYVQSKTQQKASGTYTITLEDPSDVVTKCPTSAKPGETVLVNTVGVADAYIKVYVDGEAIRTADGIGMVWQFVMPEHDVVVSATLHPAVGGGA